jgi:hypothetical protein
MKKILTILGYIWAGICLLTVLIMFTGLDSFSKQLARLPFMKINPIYSGGEVIKKIETSDYTIELHEPVFESLIGESKEGFVQMEWIWKDTMPESVRDTIDYNNDNKNDFIIHIKTGSKEIVLEKIEEKVQDVDASAMTQDGWIVRIGLSRK